MSQEQRQADPDEEKKHSHAYIIRTTSNGIDPSSIVDQDKFFILDCRTLKGHIDDEFMNWVVENRNNLSQLLLGGAKVSEKALNNICTVVLPKLSYMVGVDLSYLAIPYEAQTSLSYMLDPFAAGYCPIQKLNICRTGLGYKGCKRLFEALAGNITIKELYICGNDFTDKAIPPLVEFLQNPDNAIVSLGISDNRITAKGLKTLSTIFGNHRHISELKLSGNAFGSEGATELFAKLWQGKIKSISMNRCGITTCDWAAPMIYMTSLESLFLAQNQISSMNFQILCENLHRCACIRHLDVSYNSLNGLNTSAVGTLMKVHKGLISLNMAGNEMPGEVVSAIVLGIFANCTLRTLDLSWCNLTTEHATTLCGALAKNSLLNLRLSNNPIPDDMRNDPRKSSVYLTLRTAVELGRYDMEHDGKGRLLPENIIQAVLTSSDVVTSSGGVVAEDQEHLEFAFIDQLSAETASEMWRRRRIHDITQSKQAYAVINGLRAEDDRSHDYADVNNEEKQKAVDSELQLHIDPGAIGERAKKLAMTSQMAEAINTLDGKCILSVSYGRKTEVLGTILVEDTMTYLETRRLILPLLQNYFSTSDPKQIQSAANFKMLDGMGAVLNPEAERVRVAWAELATCGYNLHIQPADWLHIP